MSRLLLAVLLALAAPFAAADVRELQWSELIPADAPPPPPPVAMHDLSQLADALAAEAGPAAAQQSPAEPVVKELDGVQVKLPGYIVPLEVGEDGTAMFTQTLGNVIVGRNLLLATNGTASGTYNLNGGTLDLTGDDVADLSQTQYLESDALSQEIRFISPAEERLRWVAGAYAIWTDRYISTGNQAGV